MVLLNRLQTRFWKSGAALVPGSEGLSPAGLGQKTAMEIEETRIQAAYARPQDDVRYSWFSPGHLFMEQERERAVLALLAQHGVVRLSTVKILEIGCGTGYWLGEFIKWGARPDNITGVDLLPDRIATARQLSPEALSIWCGNAANLFFPDATFDLILQSMVFTSILDPAVRHQMAAEMVRVLKDDGLILWYDFHVNNPWNADVQGVKKQEIYRLFPDCQVELQRVTLVYPIACMLAPYSWLICHLLGKIPWLRTHYLGVIRKGGSSGDIISTVPRV